MFQFIANSRDTIHNGPLDKAKYNNTYVPRNLAHSNTEQLLIPRLLELRLMYSHAQLYVPTHCSILNIVYCDDSSCYLLKWANFGVDLLKKCACFCNFKLCLQCTVVFNVLEASKG